MEKNMNKIGVDCLDQTIILGNSVDIKLEGCLASEVRADVVVEKSEATAIRLWGQVKDCDGEPIPNALMKLVRVTCVDGKKVYTGMANALSDGEGFYQFDVCGEDKNACYKVLVSKSNIGLEQIVETEKGNCGVCTGKGYNPCNVADPIIVSAKKCMCNESVQPILPCAPVKQVGLEPIDEPKTICETCATLAPSSQTFTCQSTENVVGYPIARQSDYHNYQYQSTKNGTIKCK